MARITTLGDMIQIKTNITYDAYVKVKRYQPDMLVLKDSEGNPVFGISHGPANMSKNGITFCSEDADGKMFMSTSNPVCDHSDMDAEKEALTEEYAPIVHKLKIIEEQVEFALTNINDIETAVSADIVINQ